MIKNLELEYSESFGGIKIKDGLFWGDHTAAEDEEFLEINKITYLINCNSKDSTQKAQKIPKPFEKDLKWPKNDSSRISSIFPKILPEIEKLLSLTEKKHESLLIFCNSGENRSFSIIVCFLMKRYNWSLYKAIQFIDNKKPKIEIKKSFYMNLIETARIFEENRVLSKNWTKCDFLSEMEFREEEVIMRNTFLNSINGGKGFEQDFGAFQGVGRKRGFGGKDRKSGFGGGRYLKLTKSLGRKSRKVKSRIKWADRILSKSLRKKKKKKNSEKKRKIKEKIFLEKNYKKKKSKFMKTEKKESFEENKFYKFFDQKKLVNFLKKNLKSENSDSLKKNIDEFRVSTSNDFYKNNLKILQKNIFEKNQNEKTNDFSLKSGKSDTKTSNKKEEQEEKLIKLEKKKNKKKKKKKEK